jgi:hypothetical protein
MNRVTVEQRALQAYFRRFGKDAQQPGMIEMEDRENGQYVVLSNVNGVLAKYRVSSNRLTFSTQ